MRTFKTCWFSRKARAHGITDKALCRAVKDVQRGLAADLGGGVFKKRLNHNRDRALVLAKNGRHWVFVFLFAKQAQTNITGAELHAFRKLAMQFGALSDDQVESLVVKKEWVEICHEAGKNVSESGL
ncbi:type II toxin-antitoxin system RelE/ParE family toxin [Serratia marcescens]|uniref:Type II toxin-antitoxin system RelE/ParE family toxin n=1 Tax=Serratia marcescens TaxID=615 RepID=A0ABD5BMP3_SERMA|nr:type II toxin-antitoxin system RelE/ParE family toxin [Serratia marcescens]AUU09793.1 type II toxin-antitoxin system RelE/ParE family toxin [Serratia marcescens]MBH2545046.1 type II toxin-antitoxin system RelE/ParE family toxin [Serratia marcescens]MBH2916340.1 type II toxin-antitoxin system RelE/ParE family toxin [Serratia marcescens]MBH3051708.1 type II toxin-antitoxin system RelE/ParE family toxin [Serratia marcescens]MBH3209283.1 type II toxin-antitoxin system RelE/ParE family toxin [Se